MKDRFDTDYQVGQDNVKKWGMDVHPVFFVVASLVVVFIVLTLLNPVEAKKVFDGSKSWTIENFDWFFMISGNAQDSLHWHCEVGSRWLD